MLFSWFEGLMIVFRTFGGRVRYAWKYLRRFPQYLMNVRLLMY
jgi:hypothetical protein